MDDSDSDLSSLSSAPSIDDAVMEAKIKADMSTAKGLDRWFKPATKDGKRKPSTPEPPKRAPSPPHDYVLADKDSIAFIVMFRSRFHEIFPKSLPHYGPQDIEMGVSGDLPDDQVERLLCALLGLVMNRKKDVERGHYGRALEDAISEHKSQWPKEWAGTNPLSGGKSFNTMSADERLLLLKTLVLWALHSSDAVNATIKTAYKQTRRDDDRNQPKAVQPWFSDSWRRKYYLIEGQEDTYFRIYRENDGKMAKTNTWFSVAGSIEEAKALADKLEQEMPGNQGKLLGEKIRGAVPRWEAGEEKRRRREYRQARKAAFARPEPGFSLYEGRTRGKRMRYTFDDNDDFDGDSDSYSARRSTRNASGNSTPFEEPRPVVTSSGRQVKSRLGGAYGESMLIDQRRELERERTEEEEEFDDADIDAGARPVRSAATPVNRSLVGRGRYADGLESGSESDAAEPSGDEWSGNEDPEDDDSEPDFDDGAESDDEMMHGDQDKNDEDEGEEDDNTQESLVVQLRYRKGASINGFNGSLAVKERTPLSEVQNREATAVQPASGGEVKTTNIEMDSTTFKPKPDIPTDKQMYVAQSTAINGNSDPTKGSILPLHPSPSKQTEAMDIS